MRGISSSVPPTPSRNGRLWWPNSSTSIVEYRRRFVMSRCPQSLTLLISLLAALLVLLRPDLASAQAATPTDDKPQGEVAPRGQRSTIRQIKYGDWQKYCFKPPGTSQVCRTTITGTFDTGQTAVRADLIERDSERK